MRDWDDAMAFALGLPGVVLESYYGSPAPKVNGRAILSPSREPGSFAVMTTREEKTLLIDTDPDVFWESDHYRGWPAVLVRYGAGSRDRIETCIRRAWWDRLGKQQRAAAGPRP